MLIAMNTHTDILYCGHDSPNGELGITYSIEMIVIFFQTLMVSTKS